MILGSARGGHPVALRLRVEGFAGQLGEAHGIPTNVDLVGGPGLAEVNALERMLFPPAWWPRCHVHEAAPAVPSPIGTSSVGAAPVCGV
jgi:hypothetical protein